jgi:hypothetical protein
VPFVRGRDSENTSEPCGAVEALGGPPFIGSVQDHSFRIRRDIRYRNSFLPLVWGHIVPTPTGTRVIVTVRSASLNNTDRDPVAPVGINPPLPTRREETSNFKLIYLGSVRESFFACSLASTKPMLIRRLILARARRAFHLRDSENILLDFARLPATL